MMKLLRLIWIPVLLLSACNVFSGNQAAPQSLLTPYVTQTSAGVIVPTETAVPQPTPEPTLTPTPFVHVLAANETISSLALTYGLEVNDILAINPEITPKALSVGTQILIPYVSTVADTGAGSISAISEPLALTLSAPTCAPTAEGGLWCLAQVSNPLPESATGITVWFALKNGSGETISEQAVPTLLNLLAPAESLPVTAYFSADIPADYAVEAALKTALPVDKTDPGYAPLEIKVNSIDPAGRSARVSAVIPVQAADSGIRSIWVALVAYDADGRIVGVRRLEYSPVTEGEDGQAIKVVVYSNSRDIQKVDVRAEAILSEE